MANSLLTTLTSCKPVRRRLRVLMFSLSAVVATAVFATALPGAPTVSSAARSDKAITALCHQVTDAVEASYVTSLHTTAARSSVAVSDAAYTAPVQQLHRCRPAI